MMSGPFFEPLVPEDRPESADPFGWMRRQLLERRVVLLSGVLDDAATNQVGAALMTLDALADDPVHLQVDCTEGSTAAGLALMDIVDLCGVAVNGTGIGSVAGPAVGVLAVCAHRRLAPHTRVRLYEPPVAADGGARQVRQLAQDHLDRWESFVSRVAEACGHPVDRVRDDAAAGRFFSAEEALSYGLVDEIAAPSARVFRLPGRAIGFGTR